ncbi:unnamed protein product [Lactuca saligna]|uniref:Uncharacterized protein n=1 Tax=Lactuca saligna TaxID=75948 RepID=A0AA35Z3G5_LACSI|nr:unnamed protein product [Lactuca saligna]
MSRNSLERSSVFSTSMIRKPHVTQKGVVIREVPVPVSPSSYKRRDEDVAKHISKKIKKRKLAQVIPPEVSLTKSSHEEVRTLGIPTHVSDTDVNDNMGEGDLNKENLVSNQEEEDIPDHMLMSGKQFKILNKKLNSILQSQADAGDQNSVSSIEVDVMLKAQEFRLFNKVNGLI